LCNKTNVAGCPANSIIHDGAANDVMMSGDIMMAGDTCRQRTRPKIKRKAMEAVKGESGRSGASSVVQRERDGAQQPNWIKKKKRSGCRTGSALIGGPADGRVGCCGRRQH